MDNYDSHFGVNDKVKMATMSIYRGAQDISKWFVCRLWRRIDFPKPFLSTKGGGAGFLPPLSPATSLNIYAIGYQCEVINEFNAHQDEFIKRIK